MYRPDRKRACKGQGYTLKKGAGSVVEQVPHEQWLQKQMSRERVPVGKASAFCHTPLTILKML